MAHAFDVINQKWARLQFNGKVRNKVYKKLSNYLKSGVSLTAALRMMYLHASDDGKKPQAPLAVVLQQWRERIGNGDPFGTAIKGWVPEGDRVLLDGGDKADLKDALLDCIKIQNARARISGTIKKGMAYPIMLLIGALLFLIMFARKITPAFETVLTRDKWTGSAAIMGQASDMANHYFMALIISVATLFGLIWFSMPRWVGRLRVYFDRIPPWSLYRLYAGAGFMLVLSAMTKAAILQTTILQTLRKDSSPWFDERMSGALKHVANGANIGEALYLTKLEFPDPDTVRDLRGFADQDGFDEILREMGNQWIEEAVEKIGVQVGILRNVAFLIFGAIIGLFSSALTDLQNQVQQAVH